MRLKESRIRENRVPKRVPEKEKFEESPKKIHQNRTPEKQNNGGGDGAKMRDHSQTTDIQGQRKTNSEPTQKLPLSLHQKQRKGLCLSVFLSFLLFLRLLLERER